MPPEKTGSARSAGTDVHLESAGFEDTDCSLRAEPSGSAIPDPDGSPDSDNNALLPA